MSHNQDFATCNLFCGVDCFISKLNTGDPYTEKKFHQFLKKVDATELDGTKCGSDGRICLGGKCVFVRYDSSICQDEEDICGVCGGDNSTCSVIRSLIDDVGFLPVYNDLLFIPAGASSIRVKKLHPARNYIAIRNVESTFYFYGNSTHRYTDFAGTKFLYEWTNQSKYDGAVLEPDSLGAEGPTTKPVFIGLLHNGDDNSGISCTYTVPVTNRTTSGIIYIWITEDVGECSKTCGGGEQNRLVKCIHEKRLNIAHKRLCDSRSKPYETITCNNKPCPSWISNGVWRPCLRKYGGGTQHLCMNCYLEICDKDVGGSDELCVHPLPNVTQICNLYKDCPFWAVGNWSKCSVSCGEGKIYRKVLCIRKNRIMDPEECDARYKPLKKNTCYMMDCDYEETVESAYCDCPGLISYGHWEYVPLQFKNSFGRYLFPPDGLDYPKGSRLVYACKDNFELEGVDVLYCKSSGSWSSNPPSCLEVTSTVNNELKTCSNPGSIPDGQVLYLPFQGNEIIPLPDEEEFQQGASLHFSCNKGLILKGVESLTCQPSGIWSHNLPSCISGCGRSAWTATNRVTNGLQVLPEEFPWVVALGVEEKGFTNIVCGGAVWSSGVVVTAAHCLSRADKYTLYFGKQYRIDKYDDIYVQVRRSTRLIIHPYYNKDTEEFDIGLVMFEPKIAFWNRTQPICPPTNESTALNLKLGKSGYVAGFGATERDLDAKTLLLAYLPYQKHESCMEAHRNQALNISINPNIQFCAGFKNGQQSTCVGDSGLPLVFYDEKTGIFNQEGIVSFGVKGQCGLPERYTVFTKVLPLIPWINSEMYSERK